MPETLPFLQDETHTPKTHKLWQICSPSSFALYEPKTIPCYFHGWHYSTQFYFTEVNRCSTPPGEKLALWKYDKWLGYIPKKETEGEAVISAKWLQNPINTAVNFKYRTAVIYYHHSILPDILNVANLKYVLLINRNSLFVEEPFLFRAINFIPEVVFH